MMRRNADHSVNLWLVPLLVLCLVILPGGISARGVPSESGFADLVPKLLPAVVNVSTTQTVKRPDIAQFFGPFGGGEELPEGHPFAPFEEFFDRFQLPKGKKPDKKATSLGSGFIIDPKGYIVTNYHVIEGAEEIKVNLEDDVEYDAEVVGYDSKTDLALLKVEAEDSLPYVEFGDSDKARVGQWVLAIGNPFGLGGTVTSGIISARARDINAGPFDDFIQTDAAINRGNSGGPMFDVEGKVIGINTAIFSPNGVGNVGIGFAVPSALAQSVIQQIKENGTVERGWLGVVIQHVTDDIAESIGMDEPKGALVAEVAADSPADDAGIKAGDVILSFDGKEVPEMRKLPRIVAETPVSDKVDVVVWREGKRQSLTVEVGLLEEPEEEQASKDSDSRQGKEVMGMQLAVLDKNLRERFDLPEDVKGLVVLSVDQDSAAAMKGVRAGVVIKQVNRVVPETVEDFIAARKKALDEGRGTILLLLYENTDDLFVAIPLEENEE